MCTLDSKRFLTSASIALAVLLATAAQGLAQFTFGEPENLGPVVNSSVSDASPSISVDGLTLYFAGPRPGGYGGWDAWMITRMSPTDPWELPVNVGPTVNIPGAWGPEISEDGQTLYYGAVGPVGSGGSDLWMARWANGSPGDPWEMPVNLGPLVNTSSTEYEPNISADGLTLFYSSDRPDGFGLHDIWTTTRASTADPWEPPHNLGPTVNTPYGDGGPGISTDGLTLFFGSNRPGGFGLHDLWMTTRASTFDPWQTPVNLGAKVNSGSKENWPSISADGQTLYFGSNRPGGFGDFDLWQVAVIPDCPADLNNDGEVGPYDLAFVLGFWGPNPGHPADLDGDGVVGPADLAIVLGNWGPCP